MSKQYDLVVIGAGTAGMVGAMRARSAGWSVAVTDFRPYGGTCALRGCDPKKMLLAGAMVIDHVRRMRGKGVSDDVRIEWSALMAFKRSFTDPIPAKHEQRYREKGINPYHGRARFTAQNELDVSGMKLEAKHVLIATGAEPVRLGIPGEEYLTTSDAFLSLEHLPRRIVLVGGGYIASEFSHLAARAGANVTILHRGKRLLPRFDPDLVAWLMEVFQRLGIDVRTQTVVKAVEKIEDGYRVRAESEGKETDFEADLVVHSAGRAPDFSSMDLAAGGVAVEKGRLKLNEFLQSISNPAVYAAGDAAQMGAPLTPVSSHDAKVAVANMLQGNHVKPNYSGVPSVVFTIPPLALAGMSEANARESGLKFRVKSEKASDWFTAKQAAEPVYGYKTLVEENSNRIIGAHLVGPHVDEVINIFALAIRNGLTADALKDTIFGYPTGASDIGYML